MIRRKKLRTGPRTTGALSSRGAGCGSTPSTGRNCAVSGGSRLLWRPFMSLVVWIQIILRPQGDFRLHFELGRRLAGADFIYKGNLDFVYPPFWALVHAPLHFLGLHAAQIIVYPLAPAAMALLVETLRRLSEQKPSAFTGRLLLVHNAGHPAGKPFSGTRPPRGRSEYGPGRNVLAIGLLLVKGARHYRRGSPWHGGSHEVHPPSLCRLVHAQTAMENRSRSVRRLCALHSESGPGERSRSICPHDGDLDFRGGPGIERPRPIPRSTWERRRLKTSRFDPPWHATSCICHTDTWAGRRHRTTRGVPSNPPSPYYYQFLDLPVFWAGIVTRLLMAALFLWMVWLMRHRPVSRDSIEIVWECAAVSILILLFSPITWVQHAVGVLPALYLICRAAFAGFSLSRWQTAAMGAFTIFCLIMSRFFFGRDFIKLANAYRVKTLGFIILLSVVLAFRRRFSKTQRSREVNPGGENPPPGFQLEL